MIMLSFFYIVLRRGQTGTLLRMHTRVNPVSSSSSYVSRYPRFTYVFQMYSDTIFPLKRKLVVYIISIEIK